MMYIPSFGQDFSNSEKKKTSSGAPSDSLLATPNTGAVYVLFGVSTSNSNLVPTQPSSFNGLNGFRIFSSAFGSGLGISVWGAGDLNSDGTYLGNVSTKLSFVCPGIQDYMMGLPLATISGGSTGCQEQGSVLVMYGHNGLFEVEISDALSIPNDSGAYLGK